MASFKLRSIIFFAVIISGTSQLFAQQINRFDAKNLSIIFTTISNDYQSKKQALIKMSITNNGSLLLPANGWKIYFNSKSLVFNNPAESIFSIKALKGNLFQLSAMEGFKGLQAKQTAATEVILEGPVLNKNDQFEGFYLVWDDMPDRAINIKNLVTNPLPVQMINGKTISDFAEPTYRRNSILQKIADQDIPKIFPSPITYLQNGSSFLLDNLTHINTDASFIKEANLLSTELLVPLGKKIAVSENQSSGKNISLIKKSGLPAEGYEMTVKSDGVIIAASTAAGIFYGIQSLKSLLPPEAWNTKGPKNNLIITGVEVVDSPRFAYRGYLQDVARNFQTKTEILKLLDLMAVYKLNNFHFHLTDDEGWRLQIDGLPELTSIGAERGHSLDEKKNLPAAYGSGGLTDSLYGSGFYTKADFIEILQYANARHIKVIPEIETPGHARAAIKAMDARFERLMKEGKKDEAMQYFLRDTLDQSTYTTAQNFHDNVMDVAIPSTYNFIEKVVTEVVKLYQQAGAPLSTIHLGEDEVPAGVWERSPDCINLIKNNPDIKNTDGLWYYYLTKVNTILKNKGLTLSGWEEISFRRTMTDGIKVNIPNPDFVNKDMKLYVWNNTEGSEDLAYKLANNGYKVVLTFVTNFYLDMAQYKTYNDPGYYWGGYTSLEKTYQFIPYDYLRNAGKADGRTFDQKLYASKQRLTDYGKENIIGIQGSLWGETLKGPLQLEYMLLPRLTAVAEKAWAKTTDWENETDTAKSNALYDKAWYQYNAIMGNKELPKLDYLNGGYNYRIPFAGAIVNDEKVFANVQFANLNIRYTTNGEEPTIKSNLYTGPISTKGIIKLKAFNQLGRSGITTIIEN